MPWVSPRISVKWGAYFQTDPQEQLQVAQMLQAFLGAGKPPGVPLITKRQALEKARDIGVLDIDNVEAFLDELSKEQDENDQRDADKASQQAEHDAKALHAAAGLVRGKKQAAGGEEPEKAPSAGSGSARSAASSKA